MFSVSEGMIYYCEATDVTSSTKETSDTSEHIERFSSVWARTPVRKKNLELTPGQCQKAPLRDLFKASSFNIQ